MTPAIERLPKWAQNHIATLQRQRDLAVNALNEYCDQQTVSPLYYEDYLSTETRPERRVKYIQNKEVVFRLGPHQSISIRLQEADANEPAQLVIHGQQSSIVIRPSSGNAIRLQVPNPGRFK